MIRALTRRVMLGTTAAAAVPIAATAPRPLHPDADLLAACAEFDELQRAFLATDFDAEAGSPDDIERERIYDAQWELIDRMTTTPATTREGMAARARSLSLWDAELLEEDDPKDLGEFLMQAIVRDLLALE